MFKNVEEQTRFRHLVILEEELFPLFVACILVAEREKWN